jgi:hypothetical protein
VLERLARFVRRDGESTVKGLGEGKPRGGKKKRKIYIKG